MNPSVSTFLKFVIRRPEGWRLWTLFAITPDEVWIYQRCFENQGDMHNAMIDAVVDYLHNDTKLEAWSIVWSRDREYIQAKMSKAELEIVQKELDELPM